MRRPSLSNTFSDSPIVPPDEVAELLPKQVNSPQSLVEFLGHVLPSLTAAELERLEYTASVADPERLAGSLENNLALLAAGVLDAQDGATTIHVARYMQAYATRAIAAAKQAQRVGRVRLGAGMTAAFGCVTGWLILGAGVGSAPATPKQVITQVDATSLLIPNVDYREQPFREDYSETTVSASADWTVVMEAGKEDMVTVSSSGYWSVDGGPLHGPEGRGARTRIGRVEVKLPNGRTLTIGKIETLITLQEGPVMVRAFDEGNRHDNLGEMKVTTFLQSASMYQDPFLVVHYLSGVEERLHEVDRLRMKGLAPWDPEALELAKVAGQP